MKAMSQNIDSYESEALKFASIAKGIRKNIFEHEAFQFSGHFPPSCQSNCIPYKLNLLVAM